MIEHVANYLMMAASTDELFPDWGPTQLSFWTEPAGFKLIDFRDAPRRRRDGQPHGTNKMYRLPFPRFLYMFAKNPYSGWYIIVAGVEDDYQLPATDEAWHGDLGWNIVPISNMRPTGMPCFPEQGQWGYDGRAKRVEGVKSWLTEDDAAKLLNSYWMSEFNNDIPVLNYLRFPRKQLVGGSHAYFKRWSQLKKLTCDQLRPIRESLGMIIICSSGWPQELQWRLERA